MKISRTVIIIILSGIYIGLVLSGAFRKLEYLEGDVSDKTDLAKKYDALIEQGVTAEEAIEIVLNSPRSPPPVEVREKIDAWIKRNNLDTVGNPIGTMYTGGTPLFDENTGMSIDRYVYIISNNGHKPWNTEDDAVGDGVDFGRRAPETDFAASPPLKPRPDNGAVVELVSEEEERLGSLPFSGGSTVPTKPGQNAVLGNPPTMNIRDQIELGQDRLFSDFSEDEQADILARVTESLVGGNSVDVDQPRRYSIYPNHWTAQPILYDSIPITDPQYKRIVYPEAWNGKYGQSGIKLTYDWIVSNLQTDAANMKDESSYVYKELPPILARRIANTTSAPGLPAAAAAAAAEAARARAEAAVISTDPTRRVPGYVGEPVIKPTMDVGPSLFSAIAPRPPPGYVGEPVRNPTMDVGPSPETTPMPTLEERGAARRRLAAEEERDEASDTKNMNIGIGISVGVLALFLILFTYYKLRRRY